MQLVEYSSKNGEFKYRMQYSQTLMGWMISSVQINRNQGEFLPGHSLAGVHGTSEEAIAHAIEWCDMIVAHLSSERFVNDE